MNKINFQISNEIFSLFPDYCRGLIIVKNIKNSNSPPELINKIREQEIAIRKEYNTEKLLEDERIK